VWPALSLLRWPAAFLLLVAAVAALLRYAPSFRTPWRWAAAAAAAFATVWLVVTYAFGLYVAHFARYDATYGALAGVIVLMLWFYLTAFVLLCAAELAALLVRLHSPNSPATPD
jgi:membrane protein